MERARSSEDIWARNAWQRSAERLTVVLPLLLLLGHGAIDAGLSALGVMFLWQCHAQRDWRWLRAPWAMLLLALWAYMSLRAAFAPFPREALARAVPFFRFIPALAALACWTLPEPGVARRFWRMMTLSVTLAAGDGLVQYALGVDVLGHPVVRQPDGNLRLTGPWPSPVLGIMLAWLAFPVALQALYQPRLPWRRLGLPLLALAMIALSGERMALLLTLAGGVVAMLLLRVQARFFLAAACVGLALLATLAFLRPMMLERQVFSTLETLRHWPESPYGQLLKSDVALLQFHPLIGFGTNQFQRVCPTLYPAGSVALGLVCNTHPHNIYLEWGIETGGIGMMLFIAFVASVLRVGWPRHGAQGACVMLVGCFIAFCLRVWPFMASTNFFSAWGAPPFWLMTGALLASARSGSLTE